MILLIPITIQILKEMKLLPTVFLIISGICLKTIILSQQCHISTIEQIFQCLDLNQGKAFLKYITLARIIFNYSFLTLKIKNYGTSKNKLSTIRKSF